MHTNANTHTHTHTCTHAHTHTHTHTCMRTHIQVCAHARTHALTHNHLPTRSLAQKHPMHAGGRGAALLANAHAEALLQVLTSGPPIPSRPPAPPPHPPPLPSPPPGLPRGGRLFLTKAIYSFTGGVAGADAACTKANGGQAAKAIIADESGCSGGAPCRRATVPPLEGDGQVDWPLRPNAVYVRHHCFERKYNPHTKYSATCFAFLYFQHNIINFIILNFIIFNFVSERMMMMMSTMTQQHFSPLDDNNDATGNSVQIICLFPRSLC
jgi:hypothetical protein